MGKRGHFSDPCQEKQLRGCFADKIVIDANRADTEQLDLDVFSDCDSWYLFMLTGKNGIRINKSIGKNILAVHYSSVQLLKAV